MNSALKWVEKKMKALIILLGGIWYNRDINFFIWPILDPWGRKKNHLVLVQMRTRKFGFEINWPLVDIRPSRHLFGQAKNDPKFLASERHQWRLLLSSFGETPEIIKLFPVQLFRLWSFWSDKWNPLYFLYNCKLYVSLHPDYNLIENTWMK